MILLVIPYPTHFTKVEACNIFDIASMGQRPNPLVLSQTTSPTLRLLVRPLYRERRSLQPLP